MEVRLSDVLAAHCGLVKDQRARVFKVVLHETDQRALDDLPQGYRRFAPTRMARSVWLRLEKSKGLPLSSDVAAAFAGEPQGARPAQRNADEGVAGSMIVLELVGAEFTCNVTIDGQTVPMHVVRWQFPLTHAMIRTAFSAQGMTLEGGVIVDLRRAGGLQDDDWWLAIYVMLSRARKLKHLILVGFTEQVEDLLRRGPPPHLSKLTANLEKKAMDTLERIHKFM